MAHNGFGPAVPEPTLHRRPLGVQPSVADLAQQYFSTPAPVVIDEAIELARKFSSEESAQFVNAVLDAIHRESAKKPQSSS